LVDVLERLIERSDEMSERESAAKAARIDLADFSEALSTGVMRAMDARAIGTKPELDDRLNLKPWIWCGWIIGNDDVFGPLGGGRGPGGPGPIG
jgi:hypothetical protein